MLLDELFMSEEEQILDDIISESASMAWGKSGDKIVKKFRCMSGPRKGRLVNTPSDCSKKLDFKKSKQLKRTIATKGKKMAKKAKRTKRTNPVSKQVQRRNLMLGEANIVGSAIHKDKIPQKYRDMKLIGRGATSLVFEKDNDSVYIMTRDPIKQDWLIQSGLGNHVETFKSPHPMKDMEELEVDVFEMPKLFSLSKMNKAKVKKIREKFDQYKIKFKKHTDLINKLIEMAEVEFENEESLNDFVNFIMNYDEKQFYFDLLQRNFMQTKDGDLVLTDPVVSKEIVDMFIKRQKQKYGGGRF